MSKKSFKIFFCILFILVFFVAVLFLIIQLNIFSDLTKTYNECVAKIFLEKQNPNFENSVPVQKDKIVLENESVDFDNLHISFVPLKSFENELNEFKINIKDNLTDIQETISLFEIYPYVVNKLSSNNPCTACKDKEVKEN